jgi:hypothetical protein
MVSRAELADPVERQRIRSLEDKLPSLPFHPWDINYVVVATDAEVLPMFRAVDAIKWKYNDDERDSLKTKIISAERILKDF